MILADQDVVALLDAMGQNAEMRSLLCWVPLMQHGHEPTVIDRWRALAETLAEMDKQTITSVALVFAQLTKCQWGRGGHWGETLTVS